MEKFLCIPPSNPLYYQYFQHEAYRAKLAEVFRLMADKHGITTTKFYASCTRLGIVPTPEDEKRFGSQLLKKNVGEVRFFKKQSILDRDWNTIVEKHGIEHAAPPDVTRFNILGRLSYRFLVDGADHLYLQLEAPENFQCPNDCIEIKGSKFYSLLENGT